MDSNNKRAEDLKRKIREKIQSGEKTKNWGFPEECVTGGEKRVAVYFRVEKSEPNQTTSLELLKRRYFELIKKHSNWKLIAMYGDEGTVENVGFMAMMEDARAGKFDLIITKSISRFYQPTNNFMGVVMELRHLSHPVGVLFACENLYTLDKNCDRILELITLVAAEEEKRKWEMITRGQKPISFVKEDAWAPRYLEHSFRRAMKERLDHENNTEE